MNIGEVVREVEAVPGPEPLLVPEPIPTAPRPEKAPAKR